MKTFFTIFSMFIICANFAYAQSGTFGFSGATSLGQNVVETITTVTLTVTGDKNNLNVLDGGGVYDTNGNLLYTSDALTTQMTLAFSSSVNITTLQAFEADGATNTTWTFTPLPSGTAKNVFVNGSGTQVTLNFTGITSIIVTRQDGNSIAFGFDEIVMDASLPVELQSFTATPKKGKVILNWSTATEVNNYGFQVQRKKEKVQSDEDKVESEWEEVGFVEGSGNSNSVKEYSFTDNSVINGKYSYRLKQIDTDGAFEYSDVVEVVVKSIPKFFSVAQNFPNPGNPTTNINFSLPKEGHVVVKVYDILGKEISTLLDETRSADNYSITWNGLDGSGKEAASGIYLYNISFDGQSVTKKMLLVR